MLPSPRYEISLRALRENLTILADIKRAADCKIVLAQKAFSLWPLYPVIEDSLDGFCASGLWEAQLASPAQQILTYSPAYTDQEIDQLLELSHHIDFNSLSQWQRFKDKCLAHPRHKAGHVHFGLRINPEHSTGQTPLYDPCAAGSRLGITSSQLENTDLDGLSGLHFHTLCEQGAEDLASTLEAVEKKFGHILRLPHIQYFNLGGGHWITKLDYNRDLLISLVKETKKRYNLQEVWLEPGEAVAIHTGQLIGQVLDITQNGDVTNAILDVSATAHMPDVLEMPYRPDIIGAADSSTHPHCYRLGGPTCLAGDVIGDYSFPTRLEIGQDIVFDDMAHYTMVKTTTFNGVRHPAIILIKDDGSREILREFHFEDFKSRLG